MIRRAMEDTYGPCIFAGIFIALGVGAFLTSTRAKARKVRTLCRNSKRSVSLFETSSITSLQLGPPPYWDRIGPG